MSRVQFGAARARTTTAPAGSPTLWLKDSGITGSPISAWANSGSAGGSLTGVGTAQPTIVANNGHNGAAFDGSDDVLTGGPSQFTVITGSAYSAWVAFKALTLSGPTAAYYLEPALFTDGDGTSGGNFAPFTLDASGLYGGHWNGGAQAMPTTIGISTGVLYLAQVVFDGVNIIWKCNGANRGRATGAVATVTTPMRLGTNYSGLALANAEIYEVLIYNTALGSTDIATNVAYLQGRFPSAVAP